jgi:hypothetical protein
MSASWPVRLAYPDTVARPRPQIAVGKPRPFSDKWQKTGIFLIIGYILLNRAFAYLGIPQLKLFIGEIVLICFLLFRPAEGIETLAAALSRPSRLRDCAWAIVLFIGYGLFEVCRGLASGYPLVRCLETFAFNYYALYLLFGLWLGKRNPALLRTVVIRLAWLNGLYGIAFIFFLSRIPLYIPGSQGDAAFAFGQPWGAALSVLGLLCFETRLEKSALPLALNVFILLGMQVRAEWIGFMAGMLVYGVLKKQMKRIVVGAGAVVALLAIGYVANISLPGSGSRVGGVISTREIAGRALAPFDPDVAESLTGNAAIYERTAEWRTNWWKAIWASIHHDALNAAIGPGYGYPLVDLVPYLKGRYFLRTPHSIFFYALGYGGWVHIVLLGFLEGTMAALLLRSFRLTGQPYGLVAWAAINSWILFDTSLESPFRGIPFFLITGIAMAPALRSGRHNHELTLHP